MEALPTGSITFLFTDIEGSTLMVQELGEAWITVLEKHRLIMRAAIAEHHGHEMGTEGDSFFVVFSSGVDALNAVVRAQQRLSAETWPEGFPVRVRMGLHTGEAKVLDGTYVGFEVHRAARVASAGHGGQVLLSRPTAELVARHVPRGVTVRSLGEYKLKDLPTPEEIFQLEVDGLETDFPALKSLNLRRNNLPLSLTTFLGRHEELTELSALLQHERLVTILGAGGMGKTRLAIQLAAEALDRYEHGAWLVELAPVSDPSLVAATALTVFGLRPQPGKPPVETLVDYLHTRNALLVLDNCEHVVEVTAGVARQLLEACPLLRVVATSREALGVTGESVFRIPPLAVPDTRHMPAFESVASSASVELFAARGRAAKESFRLTPQNAALVVQICHDLDGIPLAIELAAARLKILSLEQIAARLKDRFRLLTEGSRTALPRQQTLRATIDWSYELLGEPERALLRRLSVFSDDFSLEAVEEVCGADPLDPFGILDLMSALVSKSLVVVLDTALEPRYRLLETIKQYAATRLTDAGEAKQFEIRHREWFLELARRAKAEFHGPEQFTWFTRLELDLENIRSALQSWLNSQEPERAVQLASAVGLFWRVTGRFDEGRDWLRRALNATEQTRNADRAAALAWYGLLTSYQGDYSEAARLQEESFVIYEELGDKWGMAFSIQNLAAALHAQDDYETANDLHERSLALFLETGDKASIGLAMTHLGFGALYRGEYDEASRRLEGALAMFREVDDRRQIGIALQFLGEVELARCHYTPAATLLRESLPLLREAGDKVDIAYTLRLLGIAARCQADYQNAIALQEESLQLARDFNIGEFVGESLTELGLVNVQLGESERAEEQLRQALSMFNARERFGISRCLEAFAMLGCSRDQCDEAAVLFGAAHSIRHEIDSSLRPYEQADHDLHVSRLRDKMREQEFDSAWRTGHDMSRDDAIAHALGTAPASRPTSAYRGVA